MKRLWVSLGRRTGMGYQSLVSAIKSCNRFFDIPCPVCDEELFKEARNEFLRCQSKERSTEWEFPLLFHRDPYGLLRSEVRRIIGRGWGKRVDRRLRVPNQRGCFDRSGGTGGTLGAKPWTQENEPCGRIRSVVAKTKGKARIVTLQNSYVKKVLRPIHEGLYDSLSQNDWLVRGELTKEHLDPLVDDLRDGEFHISGDYSQATNLIDKRAVMAVVGVLCESDHLTPEEKRVLWESFDKLEHVSCDGTVLFKRGQMMGSYLSFPILCILNRAMYLMTRTWYSQYSNEGRRVGRARPARFNGDDCAFNGSVPFYEMWKCVTGFFGMVVNHEKTGLSVTQIELNSRVFFTETRKLAPKPVLSFLSCRNDNLLLEALNSSKGLSYDTRVWIINCLILPEIRCRDVTPEALPLGIFRRLVKKSWFRKALNNEWTLQPKTFEWDEELQEFTKTTNGRGIRMVVGPRPTEENLDWFDERYRDCQREYLENWVGKKVKIPRRPWYARPRQDPGAVDPHKGELGTMFHLGKPEWAWMWPSELLEVTRAKEPWRLYSGTEQPLWLTDHPFLITRRTLIRTVKPRYFAPYLPGEWFKEGDVLRWNGEVPACPAR